MARMRKFETTSDSGESATISDSATEDSAQAKPESFGQLPFFDSSITRMMGLPVEVWLRAQTGLLKAVEPVAMGWIERRREAATAALDTFEKMSHCNDLQELCAVQRDWFEAAMRRFDTDFHALADQALALSQEAMSATRYAAQTSSEMTGLAMQTAKQAATRGQEMVQQATDQAA